MRYMLHKTQPSAIEKVALNANALLLAVGYSRNMESERLKRHFIPEWAAHRHFKSQAEFLRRMQQELNYAVDKGTISRWWAGANPDDENLKAIAHVLALSDPQDVYRHPDDDWFSRLFKKLDDEQRERAKIMLEQAFPHLKAG